MLFPAYLVHLLNGARAVYEFACCCVEISVSYQLGACSGMLELKVSKSFGLGFWSLGLGSNLRLGLGLGLGLGLVCCLFLSVVADRR